MRNAPIVLVAAALGVGTVCVARNASALGPIDLEAGAKIGAGTSPFAGPNPLGFGIGARAGVSFLGFYGGLSLMYYFGSSGDTPVGHFSEKSTLFGVEAGYGGSVLGLMTLRAQLGLGNFWITVTGDQNPPPGSNIYLEPGLTALIPLGLLYIGADVNILVLPGAADPIAPFHTAWDAAFTAHGQVGIKL